MRRKTTPRFKSSFITDEKRITYQQMEQIMTILKIQKSGTWLTCAQLVNKANKLGWTSPLVDADRLAMAHPYWRVLTDMVDELAPKFVANLGRRVKSNGDFEYMLYTDGRFKKNGTWYFRSKPTLTKES